MFILIVGCTHYVDHSFYLNHNNYISFVWICVTRTLTLITFIWTFIKNPGIVSDTNYDVASSLIPTNDLHSVNWCEYCQIYKVARSKHCSICNHCVLLFDHHCWWIGCIGGGNFLCFLSFILTLILHCFSIVLTCARHWIDINQRAQVLVQIENSSRLESPVKNLLFGIIKIQSIIMFYGILNLAIGIILIWYFRLHFQNIKKCLTLSESHKHGILKKVVKYNKLSVLQWDNKRKLDPSLPDRDPKWPKCQGPHCVCPPCVVKSAPRVNCAPRPLLVCLLHIFQQHINVAKITTVQ
ncbi:hypothetical protein P9112_004333 [Eukaryota sp. TZLM1-RC]